MNRKHQHISCPIASSWVETPLIHYKLKCGFHFTVHKDDERAQSLSDQPIGDQAHTASELFYFIKL